MFKMFKDKKAFIRNIICYFIPFICMTIIAVVFLRRTFSLLHDQNVSIMQTQMKNVLADIEEDILLSKQIADEICVDSVLSREKMLAYGSSTIAGMKKILLYGQRMEFYPTIFLTYTDKQIVTGSGTMSSRIFAEGLNLSAQGMEKYQELMQGKEHVQSCVLEKKNGNKYLFIVYYYPEGNHIDEKRIGYVFDAIYIEEALQKTIEQLNGELVLVWEEESLAQTDDLLPEGYTQVICEGEYLDVQLNAFLDNRIFSEVLNKEAFKMVAIGSISFLLLSLFLWLYGKYRYRLLYELRQLAEGHQSSVSAKGDYEIIRTVLQNSFDKINKQNQDMEKFREEAKRHLSWMLLNSAPPEDIRITELMDNYGMTNTGLYYCVLEFLIENDAVEDTLEFGDIQEILVSCIVRMEKQKVYVVGLALPTRDSNHQFRLKLIRTIKQRLWENGYFCKYVSCGLVYEQLEQMHCSQGEAFSLLQARAPSKNNKELMFFDEFTHITKKTPHFINELIEKFRANVQQQNTEELLGVLQELTAVSEDMSEDLRIYIRYKLVQIIPEFFSEEQLSAEKITALTSFVELDNVEFGEGIKIFIQQNMLQSEKKKPQAEQIIGYIQEQFGNSELSLSAVAEYFQVSERSVNRILKSSVDRTYKNYLDDLRMEKACSLLVHTDQDIKDIVKLVGYFDMSSFIRLFKRNFGVTPSEYRQIGVARIDKNKGAE